MGLLSRVEDRPTPKAVYNWRVWTCALIASWASVTIGYDSAFIGTTLDLTSFRDYFGLSNLSASALALQSENIVSTYQAGAFFGSLSAYATAHFLGRKKSIFIYVPIFILGACLMLGAAASPGLALIYAGRVFVGFGIGGTSMVVPIYISEISPPAIRGALVGIWEFGWQIGGLVGFWINYGITKHIPTSNKQWIIPFAVQLIPAGLLFMGAFWLPESPRWLLTKNKREKALKNLAWIRNLDPDDLYLIEEVAFLDAALEEQTAKIGSGFWAPFKAIARSRQNQWRLVLGGLLFMWQNGSGINAINYYSPTVFESLGLEGETADFLTTGLFGVVKTVLAVVWLLFLIDHLGRRKLLMIGSLGGSICMWIIGGYLASTSVSTSASTSDPPLTKGGIAAIFFFYLWTAFYSPTWNGTPWVMNSEMFDQSIRSVGQASAAANNWFWGFIITRFTPEMFISMGTSGCGVYFFFASMMLASIPFVYFLVPETKGIPLESMDRLFQVRPVWKANEIVHEEDRIREEEFRHDAAGAGLSNIKTKFEHIEEA